MKRIRVWLAIAAVTGMLTGCWGDGGSSNTTTSTTTPPPTLDASQQFTATVVAEAGTASARSPDDISTIAAAGSETDAPIDISSVAIGI